MKLALASWQLTDMNKAANDTTLRITEHRLLYVSHHVPIPSDHPGRSGDRLL